MNERGSRTIGLFTWLWRSHVRTALIALICVEAALIAVLLIGQEVAREEKMAAMHELGTRHMSQFVDREAQLITERLSGIELAVDAFRRHAEYVLGAHSNGTEHERRPDGTTTDANAPRDGGFALLGPMARQLTETQPLAKRTFIDTTQPLGNTYPSLAVQDGHAAAMNVPGSDVYTDDDNAGSLPRAGSIYTGS